MVTDQIADLLIRIKNGSLARREAVEVPYSQNKEKIAMILKKKNYLKNVKIQAKRTMICELQYQAGKPALTSVQRVSKPGRRVYKTWQKIPWTLSGYGITLVSTSQGIMTDQEARKKKLGGEIIAQIW